MAKREEVWKNVSSTTTTTTQDIKLNCTVESLKAVADNVDVMPEKPKRNKKKLKKTPLHFTGGIQTLQKEALKIKTTIATYPKNNY